MLWRILFFVVAVWCSSLHAGERPNILWLSTEDMSPNLGCYGDEQARTPNIDKLAAEGVLFANAFVPNPVCATCRSSIITGVYSVSLGTHHMRSRVKLPAEIRCFPEYLREAGYYCTNNEKQDYNFQAPPDTWDESSRRAHWKHRPSADTPFFAVFNYTGTHESSIRGDEPKYTQVTAVLAPEERHDPAKLELPPYYPDTPKVREHWARYYNVISSLDHWIAERLAELDEAGVAEDTIVFFWSDHGAGIPRGKRWLHDSGMRVPLIVRVPEKWRHLAPLQPGEVRDQLISLVDLGPTVLNLTGVSIPKSMQGRPFLRPDLPPPREYVFGARDRMDETYDMSRAVRDQRFKYIRNYMPQRPYAQTNSYGDNNDIMREWRRLKAEGKLDADQSHFMSATKPPVEHYDVQADPFELHNLAGDARYTQDLERLSRKLDEWMLSVRDLGVVPEGMLERSIPDGTTRYELFRGPGGEEKYQEFADAAKRREAPPSLAEEFASDPSNGPAEMDDAIRVFIAEQALDDASADVAAGEQAIDELLDVIEHGASRFDQVAAANVLDLHLQEGPQAERLARVSRGLAGEQRHSRRPRHDLDVKTLRKWTTRFVDRFSKVSAATE